MLVGMAHYLLFRSVFYMELTLKLWYRYSNSFTCPIDAENVNIVIGHIIGDFYYITIFFFLLYEICTVLVKVNLCLRPVLMNSVPICMLHRCFTVSSSLGIMVHSELRPVLVMMNRVPVCVCKVGE